MQLEHCVRRSTQEEHHHATQECYSTGVVNSYSRPVETLALCTALCAVVAAALAFILSLTVDVNYSTRDAAIVTSIAVAVVSFLVLGIALTNHLARPVETTTRESQISSETGTYVDAHTSKDLHQLIPLMRSSETLTMVGYAPDILDIFDEFSYEFLESGRTVRVIVIGAQSEERIKRYMEYRWRLNDEAVEVRALPASSWRKSARSLFAEGASFILGEYFAFFTLWALAPRHDGSQWMAVSRKGLDAQWQEWQSEIDYYWERAERVMI